ncbi:MAG: hypothetical protein CMO01_30120 [Thalassobius sp.]|nr:hypothetical protein [Thalassovita sp.]
MKKDFFYSIIIFLLFAGCNKISEIEQFGLHYQQHQDYKSLSQVLDLMEEDLDTGYVKHVLGEPIDMGFDYRYLIDSTGPNGCVVGAVFHIDDSGKIDQKWIGEVCE